MREPRISITLDAPHGRIVASNDRDVRSGVTLGDVSGWHGGVAVAGTFADRLGHGQFPTRGRGGPRILSLSLSKWAPSDPEVEVFRRSMSGTLADGEDGVLTVDWDGHALSATVQRDGEVSVSHDAGYATALLPLRAVDPFLYGEETVTFLHPIGTGVGLEYPLYGQQADPVLSYGAAISAQDPISNPGNAEAWPRFLVVGDFPSGFQISIGGRVVMWPRSVVPQAPVTVDMAGSIWIGGANHTHRAGVTQWSSIPPGGTVYPEFTPIQFGSGWAEAHVRPTFI